MSLNLQYVKATNLNDAWFQTLFKMLEEGTVFKIDRGSYAGQKRLEFDWVTVHIKNPGVRPLLPQIEPHYNIPNPVADDYLDDYLPYLMTGELKADESYCYDEKTEILTKNGWISFSEYIENFHDRVEVATLNPNTDELEWQLPTNFNRMKYKGEIYKFKSKQIDMCVTPNHTMYVSKMSSDKNEYLFNLKKANEMNRYKYRFKKNCVWNGKGEKYFSLPPIEYNNSRYNTYGKQRKIPMDSWLKFFGVWLADGSIRKYKNKFSYDVVVTKTEKSKDRDYIYDIMKDIFGNVTKTKKDLVANDKQIWKYLEQFGKAKDKFIPNYILELNSEQLKILFDHMYLCDGSKKRENTEYCRYSTISKRLADNVQELCLKIGFSANIKKDSNVYRVNINNKNKYTMANVTPCISIKDNLKIEEYDGTVYCVEVPKHHVLYVRRNGIPCWCGNTYGQRLTAYPIDFPLHMHKTGHWPNIVIEEIDELIEKGIIFNTGKWCLNQIELMIWTYQNKGYRNNQMVLQVAHPNDMLLQDPPCLRAIDTRIQDGKLHFYPYFRSWDLYGGFPANLGGIQLLKEYCAEAIGVEDGEIIATSKGLHIYDYAFDLAKCLRMKDDMKLKGE